MSLVFGVRSWAVFYSNMNPLARNLCLLALLVGSAVGQVAIISRSYNADEFINAVPIFPQIRTPDFPLPDQDEPKIVYNERFTSNFNPTDDCSFTKTDIKVGETGSISTPNYPMNYPASTLCEWYIESAPGTRIEATVFDLVTQPWFFTYFDYVMFAKDGNFSNVDRIAGDMNGKTPMTLQSSGNKFGVRFRSSSLFSFRGMKLQYLVVPEDPAQSQWVSPFQDGCGISPILDAEAIATSPPPISIADVVTVAGADAPVLTPGHRVNESLIRIPASPFEFDPKIIGHSPAPRHAYPWMVAMLIDGKQFCGGSLIDNQHVMTAAHCTDRAKKITLLFGSHNIRSPLAEEPTRVVVNVTSDDIFQHPDYNSNTIANDISIIKLPQKLVYTNEIRPVCLPNKYYMSNTFVGEDVRVTGWGKNSDQAPSVNPFLQQAGVKIMANSRCRYYFRGLITGNLICIETRREVSPCRGDSGGPLVVEQQGPQGPYYMQLGVVSFGSYTCEKAFPVGFTRVTAFMDFIEQVTGRKFL